MEVWRATHRPGYEVSNHGRVRSWIGPGGTGRVHLNTPRILIGHVCAFGYFRVVFWPEAQARYVHRLVAAAFIGPCPVGHVVMHQDDNPRNSHVDNLDYGTPLQNAGAAAKRQRFSQAKLTIEQVREIKQVYAKRRKGRAKRVRPGTIAMLAKQYNVSDSTIEKIGNGLHWRHV